MILATQHKLGEYQVTQTLGLVYGNTVRSRNIVSNTVAGWRTLIGGEVKGWTKVCTDSRDEALQRLVEHAKSLGADAILGIQFTSTEVGPTASEILVYGTAVKLKKK